MDKKDLELFKESLRQYGTVTQLVRDLAALRDRIDKLEKTVERLGHNHRIYHEGGGYGK